MPTAAASVRGARWRGGANTNRPFSGCARWRGSATARFPGFVPVTKAALDDLFVQVLGMLSAEGLITLERVTLDGTKIKAHAGGNTFRRKETLEAHLQLAREQVRLMEQQAAAEEQMARRQVAARRRAARQRQSRLEAAVREVERLQSEKKEDRDSFVARASAPIRKPT
jgi:hypothetical protein